MFWVNNRNDTDVVMVNDAAREQAGRAQRWKNLRIGQRIAVGYGMLVLFVLSSAGIGAWGTHELSKAIDFVTGPAWSTADGAMEGVIGIEKQMLAVERYATGLAERDEAAALLKEGSEMADEALGRAMTSGLIDDARVAQLKAVRADFDRARGEMWRLTEQGALTPEVRKDYERAADALLADIDEVEVLGDSQVEGYVEVAAGVVAGAYTQLAIGVLAALALAFFSARGIIGSVTNPIAEAVRVANRVSSGKLDEPVKVETRDETGELLAALRTMQEELRARIEREQAQAEDVRKIQSAMNQASAAMMLVDTSDRVIFANNAMKATCGRIGALSARDVDGVPVQGLLSAASRGPTLAELRQRQHAEYTFGQQVYELFSNAVTSGSGQVIGTVIEWQELTQQRAAEQEMARVLQDAIQGRLGTRLNLDLMHGFMGELGANVNRMLDAIVTPLTQTSDYLARISHGDVPNSISGNFQGDFKAVEENLTRSMDAIRVLVRDTQRLGEAAANGNLEVRADLGPHEGEFRRIVQGVNATLDAVTTPVRETQRVMQSLAEGDLTQTMKGRFHGEFERMQASVNGSVEQLRGLIENILSGADLISSSSSEIKNGNMDLSNRTERQASSVQQTTSNMGELTEMVRRNAEQARQANGMAASAADAAREGGDVVGRAVRAMSEIDRASKEISDIIGVVDEIAFQTNLLALNASVEAARAGEQGRGFAVVAGEVRNLAQRSAGAARQIKELINASVTRVNEGSELVRASGDTLERIVSSVSAVSTIISGIADDSDAQYDGIQRISATLMEIDEGTQQNAAMVEEVASASASMDDQATSLRDQVGMFRTQR
jgi:methyl-accepting chemotaxis protein